MRRISPDAEDVEVIYGDAVKMFDCGGNLDTIACPACSSELDTEWWQGRIDERTTTSSTSRKWNFPAAATDAR